MPLASRFATALLSASSITLAFWLAYALHLERPYWAGIAAMVLSFSAQGQSLQKGLWRMAGTVAGAAAGMAVLACFGEARLSLLLACGVLLALLVMLMRGSSYSYFYYSTALMAVLAVAQSHGEAPFRMACARMEENLAGIAAYTLCALCSGRRRQAARYANCPALAKACSTSSSACPQTSASAKSCGTRCAPGSRPLPRWPLPLCCGRTSTPQACKAPCSWR